MTPRVVILAPNRPDGGERDALWAFTKPWWIEAHPDWPIFEGSGPSDGLFSRSAAVNEAARKAGDFDACLIIDTDVLTHPPAVRTGIDVALRTGQMVVTHDQRIMLSKAGTQKILKGYRGNWRVAGMEDRVWYDSVSSSVAVTRELWDRVGGFDECFRGWGREDSAFQIACETLSGHAMLRVSSECFHLWHSLAPEGALKAPSRIANEARCDRYVAARWNAAALAPLLTEARGMFNGVPLTATTIPRILHRTVPAETTPEVEGWWAKFRTLHPGWDFRTYREPIDPAAFPLTSGVWDKCQNGAQKAGLIRLEAVARHGGVYVDSDVEPFRSLEPLLHLPMFAGWEDETTVPDAVFGAAPDHPAVEAMLDGAVAAVKAGRDAWQSGPGVFTSTLPGRTDCLLLAPGHLYPAHYLEKAKLGSRTEAPWVMVEHKWAHSWGSDAQRQGIDRRQRP